MNGLVVFPTFFSLSMIFAIRRYWSKLQSAPCLIFLLTIWSFSTFSCKEYNQSYFSINHLVMFLCRAVIWVVAKGYFLWPECSLNNLWHKIFALLHFVSGSNLLVPWGISWHPPFIFPFPMVKSTSFHLTSVFYSK